MNSITEIEDSAVCDEDGIMLKRVITGICVLAVVIPVLIFSDTWVFPIAIAAISVICIYELARCMGLEKHIFLVLPLYIFALAFPFLQRFFENDFNVASIAIIAIIFYVAHIFGWVIFSRGKIPYPEACTLCLTAFYVLFALNTVIFIRDYTNGQYIYLLIFIGAWLTDTFAYFTGRLFGKHKLAPDISPKKTIEGSIGGTVFCSIGFVVMGAIVGAIAPETSPNYLYLAISGLIIAGISQAGDLIMSAIKRHYGVKDFGNILPGHGGMLDRMDSILSVSIGIEMLIMFTYLTKISLF